MKTNVIAILMALLLAAPGTTLAQKHRHTPRIESTVPPDTTGIEAYSDTTYVDTTDVASNQNINGANGISWDDDDDIDEQFSLNDLDKIFGLGATGTEVVAIIVFGVISIMPFLIIALIVWLVIRSRNRRYKVVEKAMESGQPIPNQLIEPERTDMWQRGIRNIFLGIGIAVFCYCFHFGSLAGIGWLIAICGVGQAVIGKSYERKNRKNEIDNY